MMRSLVVAAMLLLAPHAAAFDAPKYAAQCLSCHGINGRPEIPYVPIIHGQQTTYLRDALHAYREGWRKQGRGFVMSRIVRNFSDSEIDALATWFGHRDAQPESSALVAQLPRETTVAAAVPQALKLSRISPAAATPSLKTRATTDKLVYIDKTEGWERILSAEHNGDYFILSSYVESEKFLTFCAIASMAAVLNSLDIVRPSDPVRYPYPFFTQENLFVLANQKVRSFEEVVTSGLDLAQISAFLEHMPVVAKAYFADDYSADDLRGRIRETLNAPNARVIVNYDRRVVGQVGAGHVSPIGAYDADTDSVLILDVARYKYPPAWVPMALLHKAMLSKDSASNRARGIVVVESH